MSISEVINIENDDYVYFSNSNYLYRVSKNEQIVEVPSKLKQEILSPYMDSRDEVEI
ncbi:MAG: hypothetical protein P1U46_01320 [Patescibacteria group bacterium]|nr:hypothetical protein [Patescibacteria group bacterium]